MRSQRPSAVRAAAAIPTTGLRRRWRRISFMIPSTDAGKSESGALAMVWYNRPMRHAPRTAPRRRPWILGGLGIACVVAESAVLVLFGCGVDDQFPPLP